MQNNQIDRKSFKGRVYRWGPVALWMLLIFGLSAQSKLPYIPGFDRIEWADKIKHFVAYAVLSSLIWRALSRNSPKWWQIGATIALATAYGFSDESHQLYVPGRTFDLFDLTSDAFGSATAAVILTLWIGGEYIDRRAGKELRSKGQEAGKPGRDLQRRDRG